MKLTGFTNTSLRVLIHLAARPLADIMQDRPVLGTVFLLGPS